MWCGLAVARKTRVGWATLQDLPLNPRFQLLLVALVKSRMLKEGVFCVHTCMYVCMYVCMFVYTSFSAASRGSSQIKDAHIFEYPSLTLTQCERV